jgi:hypothetical protein
LISLLFFVTVVGLQWAGGAFSAEFGQHSDETAHYVGGLMVRDYIAALAPAPPMKFAEDYYLHYPKMALGHWPPFFYIVQAAWTSLFSASRVSVLVLMALLTTLLAVALHLVLRGEFSTPVGIGSGLLLISLPMVQAHTGMVMSESLVTLLAFCAVLFFGRYIDTERWQDAAWFGLLASFAILTKATGFTLALVPPMATLLSRRFQLLLRPSFWLPAVIVLVLCGPWYALAPGAMHEIEFPEGRLAFSPYKILDIPRQLVQLTGAGLLLLIGVGLSVRIVSPIVKRKQIPAKWAAVAALLLSFVVFRSWVPIFAAHESRYLVTIVPPLIMFLIAGVSWLATRLPLGRLTARHKIAFLALLGGLVYMLETFTIPEKASYGFQEVAQDLLSRPQFRDSVFLISSEAGGEGRFTSEVAMRERRPGHYVLRATKVLASVTWFGHRYTPNYRTPAQLMDYLESVPVGVLVMDYTPGLPLREHHRLLQAMLKAYPESWELIGSYSGDKNVTASGGILVYRLVGHESKPLGKIRIDMRDRLNKILEN